MMIPNSSEEGIRETSQILSKNQLKKQLRRQRWLDSRPERRKKEKERRKQKRKHLAQTIDESMTVNINNRFTLMKNSNNKFKVVIDLNFEDYMTDSEIGKVAKQVARIYSLNRHSENPCQLYITSLKGRIEDRFSVTNAGYLNWDVNISKLDYSEVLYDNTTASELNKFLYLSGDSDNTLPDVDSILHDDSRIFIIGGLVDHNRYKNLCHKLAVERNIATAKLPIKENITLSQRHILSTVTVFEIILHVLGSHKQWSEAFLSAIPKRKVITNSSQIDLKSQNTPTQTDAENLEQQPPGGGGDEEVLST